MKHLIKSIEKVINVSLYVCICLASFLVLLMTADVVLRYAFNWSVAGTFELEWQVFSVIILLGMGSTLKYKRHVRVDIFFNRMSEKKQLWVDILFSFIFMFPFCLMYIFYSFPYALHAFETGEGSPDAGGLPAWWIVKFFMPLGFTILLLQGIIDVYNNIIKLRKL